MYLHYSHSQLGPVPFPARIAEAERGQSPGAPPGASQRAAARARGPAPARPGHVTGPRPERPTPRPSRLPGTRALQASGCCRSTAGARGRPAWALASPRAAVWMQTRPAPSTASARRFHEEGEAPRPPVLGRRPLVGGYPQPAPPQRLLAERRRLGGGAPRPCGGPQEGDAEAAASPHRAPRLACGSSGSCFSRLLPVPAPPGPLSTPSGSSSGLAAAGRCARWRALPEGLLPQGLRGCARRPAAERDPAGPARGGEGRRPRASGMRRARRGPVGDLRSSGAGGGSGGVGMLETRGLPPEALGAVR